MIGPRVLRHALALAPQSDRVIFRRFIPSNANRIMTILGRAMALSEAETALHLAAMVAKFQSRHFDLERDLMTTFRHVAHHLFTDVPLSMERRLLIGALFSGEFALESAALFNPSIVPHPDQSGVPDRALRFVMSLRATGEGHISSIEFRTGLIRDAELTVDPVSRRVMLAELAADPAFNKVAFAFKLHEMGFDNLHTAAVLDTLGEWFSLTDLNRSLARVRREGRPVKQELHNTLRCILWLADSNYEMSFSPECELGNRAIFPVSASESNGIEDARFVRFVEDDGSVMYYATYTAFSGSAVLPQLIETPDFLRFRVLTLNGSAVQNKGMALFPRRIHGNYTMLSRQDDENLFILYSDNPHYWNDPTLLIRPREMWEAVKIGNCGSPLETPEGWLVITHGVGPMRTYSIGAVLLDLDNPAKVIGRLRTPLITPEENGREGYVPNVVYSCGSLIHAGTLVLPFALSDQSTTYATVDLGELLAALLGGAPA
ncbi:MAG TPA: glycoside hydrolase family 130 protein [Holophaga sp.]|nr:glycoside hydrolase family 130 protein [Holophaga sp.]